MLVMRFRWEPWCLHDSRGTKHGVTIYNGHIHLLTPLSPWLTNGQELF